MPKKTLNQVVKSKSHYIVGVKGNQKNLLKDVKKVTKKKATKSKKCTERNRGRLEKRKVELFKNSLSKKTCKKWRSINTIVKVTRDVEIKGKTSNEIAYFISDLNLDLSAHLFGKFIRNHWGIESFHFTKDVIFEEDNWKVKNKNAAANYSLLRNLAINVFRHNGAKCIKAFVEKCANNVPLMQRLIGFSV